MRCVFELLWACGISVSYLWLNLVFVSIERYRIKFFSAYGFNVIVLTYEYPLHWTRFWSLSIFLVYTYLRKGILCCRFLVEDAEGLRCFSDGMEAFAVCGIGRCMDVVFLSGGCLASKGKMKGLYASLSH